MANALDDLDLEALALVTQIDSRDPEEAKVLQVVYHLIMFRDMRIRLDVLARWVRLDGPIPGITEEIESRLLGLMWTNLPLVRKILAIGIEHSGIGLDGLPEFRNVDRETAIQTFREAFNWDIIALICKPIARSIDIASCFQWSQRIWIEQYLTVFIAVALTIWNTMEWDRWEQRPAVPVYDKEEVWFNARTAVTLNFSEDERPSYDQIALLGPVQLPAMITPERKSTNMRGISRQVIAANFD